MARGNILRPRSLVHALASRERGGRCSRDDLEKLLPRRRWTMAQVLSRDDCAVLLGFSSDGNYLLYYSVWGASYVVLWKRIHSALAADRVDLLLALRLQVGKQTPTTRSFDGRNAAVGSRLRVWQSTNDQLVAVIASDSHLASQDAGPTYHITLSPSPSFCDTQGCARSTSLSFSYTLPSPTQEIESWQLLSVGACQHLLVLNMGSSMVVLVLHVRLAPSTLPVVTCSGQPRVHFDQRPWYAPSEYPLEFSHDESTTISSTRGATATLECPCQHEFDCEAFLASFFRKYAAFHHLHLVDYDFRLVRANLHEKKIFMTCAADLESSPSITNQRIDQSRLALFLTLEIYSGDYHVIRALKVPRQQPLRHLSTVLARQLLVDLMTRTPMDPLPTEWNNDPVERGESLNAVHNPRFPISIYLK